MSASETEEQRMLRDSLAKFLADHRIEGGSKRLWSGLSNQLGLTGALLPGSVGGLGGGAAEAAIIAREFGVAGVAERAAVYLEGGCVIATAPILIVDSLNGRVNAKHVSGLIVNDAHRVSDTSRAAFIAASSEYSCLGSKLYNFLKYLIDLFPSVSINPFKYK